MPVSLSALSPVAVVRTADGVSCEPLDVALTESIGQVRDRIAESLSVGSEAIQLSYNGACKCVPGQRTLSHWHTVPLASHRRVPLGGGAGVRAGGGAWGRVGAHGQPPATATQRHMGKSKGTEHGEIPSGCGGQTSCRPLSTCRKGQFSISLHDALSLHSPSQLR